MSTLPFSPIPFSSPSEFQILCLGQVFIENIFLQMWFELNLKDQVVTGTLFSDMTYPKTRFSCHLQNKDNNTVNPTHPAARLVLGSLTLRVSGLEQTDLEKTYADHSHWFPWKTNISQRSSESINVMHLSGVYVRAKTAECQNLVTPEESLVFRGMGKRMISKTLAWCVQTLKVDAASWIMLEADGGHPSVSRVLSLEKQHSRANLWSSFSSNFPWAATLLSQEPDLSHQDLATHFAQIEENAKLIVHYEHEYGFTLAQSGPSMAALMISPLRRVLQCCCVPVFP